MKGTMLSIVHELLSSGHQVDFYIRKDGGILVRSIDGQHYKGAKGNIRAREMTGQKLSEARFRQLSYATQVRMHPVKNIEVKDSIKKEYQRVKKLWSKAFKSKGGKPHPAGYFGWKRIKQSIKDYGEAEALRRISEAERYATGIAYSKNVQILATFIKIAGDDKDSNELRKLSEDIIANAYSIREEWIEPAYKELYLIDKGVDIKQVAQNVRRILRL